jgi:hypothetical protein
MSELRRMVQELSDRPDELVEFLVNYPYRPTTAASWSEVWIDAIDIEDTIMEMHILRLLLPEGVYRRVVERLIGQPQTPTADV